MAHFLKKNFYLATLARLGTTNKYGSEPTLNFFAEFEEGSNKSERTFKTFKRKGGDDRRVEIGRRKSVKASRKTFGPHQEVEDKGEDA